MSVSHPFSLPSYALFAAMLGMAGLPIYIHAPKYFVDTYGVSLSLLGVALFGLRLIDLFQDPLLGHLAEKTLKFRSKPVWISGILMSLGMFGLFAVPAPISPVIWFSVTMAVLFTGFSFLSIRFYSQGVTSFGSSGQLHLARWRETGSLLGVCLAAMAPTLLLYVSQNAFSLYALLFLGITLVALFVMQSHWSADARSMQNKASTHIWSDRLIRQMLFLAVLNTAPVAVSSTLFLFFVESRLLAPEMTGILLIIFFLSAAFSAPFWAYLADQYGARRILLLAMLFAIHAFVFAFFLTEGQTFIFSIICLASGATLGADLTILPAIFARHLAQTGGRAEIGFGLWNFASKISLAIAAVIVLPMVELFGFRSGMENTENGLLALTFGYALLPCLLKLFAIGFLLRLRFEDIQT